MGLFDFVRNIGHQLFDQPSEADKTAAAIQGYINASNPGIDQLRIEFRDPVVYLFGAAQSAEALQKAALMAGNLKGVESVNVDGVTLPPGVESPQAVKSHGNTQYYVIQSGDTLSKIAKQFYGDANRYPQIFEANREVIQDVNRIFPGQKIRIPAQS